jgi:hypothetical protein
MKTEYFWPIHGEDHEAVFTFNESRGRQRIKPASKKFSKHARHRCFLWLRTLCGKNAERHSRPMLGE